MALGETTSLRVVTPAKSVWEVVNSRSTRLAETLEDNEPLCQLIEHLLSSAILFADTHGIRSDEIEVGDAKMSQDGLFFVQLIDPYHPR